MATTNCKTTYDWLIKIREKECQIEKAIQELNEFHIQAKIDIAKQHGYPLEGDVINHKGTELKLERLGSERYYLTKDREYSILVPKKVNGEWSKRSSGISLTSIEGIPCSHEYGVSWLISVDEEIVYTGD